MISENSLDTLEYRGLTCYLGRKQNVAEHVRSRGGECLGGVHQSWADLPNINRRCVPTAW